MPTSRTSLLFDSVLLRMARADDDGDLIRLAQLDSARPVAGCALVAEENGEIVAALCLSTGRAVANPFVKSLHLVELLRQHAARHAPASTRHGRRRLPRPALGVAER